MSETVKTVAFLILLFAICGCIETCAAYHQAGYNSSPDTEIPDR